MVKRQELCQYCEISKPACFFWLTSFSKIYLLNISSCPKQSYRLRMEGSNTEPWRLFHIQTTTICLWPSQADNYLTMPSVFTTTLTTPQSSAISAWLKCPKSVCFYFPQTQRNINCCVPWLKKVTHNIQSHKVNTHIKTGDGSIGRTDRNPVGWTPDPGAAWVASRAHDRVA